MGSVLKEQRGKPLERTKQSIFDITNPGLAGRACGDSCGTSTEDNETRETRCGSQYSAKLYMVAVTQLCCEEYGDGALVE